MEQLFSRFRYLVSRTELVFVRYLYSRINWENRLIAIVGSRGVGKTTMLFQHIKMNYEIDSSEVLYVSLDNLWFANHTLIELADEFHKNGGKTLFLDEVHKYQGWSREIKNIYDSYPEMKVVFTGSSLLDIHRSGGDLSRRARKYTLYGMSFREYLEYEHGIKQSPLELEALLVHHIEIAAGLGMAFRPIVLFKDYLKYGYFPYFKEDKEGYFDRLSETVNTIIEVDLPATIDVEYSTIIKIKKLFSIIAAGVPFTPNISRLAEQVGTTRSSLLNYLEALGRAQAILMLDKEAQGLKRMAKPEKIYLGNTNYAYAFSDVEPNIGSVRDTFFYSMLRTTNRVGYSSKIDFVVDGIYNFEIGGKDKGQKQVADLKNAFVVKDNIEIGTGNQIPLWMFGLLY